MTVITKEELSEVVHELFDELDTDRSGVLEKAEIKVIAMKLQGNLHSEFDDAEFEAAFKTLDGNSNG